MTTSHKLRTPLAVSAMILATLVLPVGATGSAQAAGSGCTHSVTDSGRTGSVFCSKTPGMATRQHRVVVTCIHYRGTKVKIYGPWVYGGHTSSATCSPNGKAGVFSVDHERRSRG
ncbi:hypothetical protein [Streptomyces sp. NRRL S-87]|uniref:hypothetical protein n=1 Tax=Streptomyces sp. NRRL S-87 TaxID=1463920 RepID=UPI00131ABFA3|nr:hypothetical protein [Streptomyces sp. NRRL S-87]